MLRLILFIVIAQLSVGCAPHGPSPSMDEKSEENAPDARAAFVEHKHELFQLKAFGRFDIERPNVSFEKLGEGVPVEYKYTYLMWVYTGYYDSATAVHPWYLFPDTPKGEMMRKGLFKGIELHTKITEQGAAVE